MPKHPPIYYALALVCTLSVVVWHQRQTTCDSPLAYSIGQFDSGFGLKGDEFQETIRHASRMWEEAVGKRLFTYDPTAPFTINLVFDDRQKTTLKRQKLSHQLALTELSHKKLADSYDYWQESYQEHLHAYEDAIATYETRLEAYNRAVEHWNTRGGAPPDVYRNLADEGAQLTQRKDQLENERRELSDLYARLKSLGKQSQELVATYNYGATTYNALYGMGAHFHKGEYDGKAITIYQFHDRIDLTLVIAHELGHALGIKHINDPKAIMHALMGEQEIDPLLLTSPDVDALRTACRGH